jgi:hypothetical protein
MDLSSATHSRLMGYTPYQHGSADEFSQRWKLTDFAPSATFAGIVRINPVA